MGQYTLPFEQQPCYSKEHFFVSDCNRQAYTQIEQWPDWNTMILIGPAGSGKSHLGHIWAQAAKALIINGHQDALKPDAIETNLLVDDMETCEETALFHTINLCKEKKFSLLLTCSKPVKQLEFTLPDLTSRLLAMPAATIQMPDDEALAGVMRKQFADRQIGANEEVIQYLLHHGERSFSYIATMVEKLDTAMWEQKKNLTIPFIRKLLHNTETQAG